MRNKLIAMCAALAVCMSFTPLTPSAAEISDTDAYLCYDVLQGIIDNYSLDTSAAAGENSIAYFYGRTNQGEGYPVACLWVGSTGYRCTFRDDLDVPEIGYYTANYSCNYTAKYAGYLNLVAFWYDPSVATDNWKCNIISGRTDNLIGYNTLSAYTDSVEYSELNNLDELLASLAPAEDDPTEVPVATAPPFTLPNEWIDGGETLASATVEDFSIDESEAFAVLDSINLDEIESNTGLQNGFGSIWSFVSELWVVFSVGGITIVCLLIMLLSWFFGRRL